MMIKMPTNSASPLLALYLVSAKHSDFQSFLFHGTHKLITEIHGMPKNMFFCHSDKKIGIIWIHSQLTAIAILAVVIFFYLAV